MSAYLTRLICAAILCAVIRAMAGEGQGIRKLICGMFLALTVLSAPIDLKLPDLDPDRIAREGQTAVQEGEEQAESAREAIIIEALGAYIWNKAAGLDLDLTVRLELAEDQTPDTVILTGTAAPGEQERLTEELVRELGIGEEDVIWIQPHQSSE